MSDYSEGEMKQLELRLLEMEHGEWLTWAKYYSDKGPDFYHLFRDAADRCAHLRGEMEAKIKTIRG